VFLLFLTRVLLSLDRTVYWCKIWDTKIELIVEGVREKGGWFFFFPFLFSWWDMRGVELRGTMTH
jgi:hypothetical protein